MYDYCFREVLFLVSTRQQASCSWGVAGNRGTDDPYVPSVNTLITLPPHNNFDGVALRKGGCAHNKNVYLDDKFEFFESFCWVQDGRCRVADSPEIIEKMGLRIGMRFFVATEVPKKGPRSGKLYCLVIRTDLVNLWPLKLAN